MPRERVNPPAEALYARTWQIWSVVMVGLFMALLDVTIVNISIPELQRELDASVGTVSWVLNAYNITFAVLLVSMGRLADQLGRKRMFVAGLSIFTLGSGLCALAPDIDALIAFRVLQAVGAAVLAPLALAMTTLVFPPHRRGLGLALLAVIANFAAAIGPPLGGVLLEVASWHWIFAINVPIGIAGIVAALRTMPETYDLESHRRIDWIGSGLLGGGVFCLTYGLVEANDAGWGSAQTVGLLAAAALLTAAFALSQRIGRFPMLTAALVRNRQFVGASGAILLFGAGMMGTLFLAVLLFVNLWGYSELEAAFAVSPVALAGLVVAPLVSRVADRVPPRAIGVPALGCVAAGMLLLARIPAEPDYLEALPGLALAGAGIGAAFPAVNVGAMGSIAGGELGLGSGIVNMSRQLGFAVGIAVLVAVFTGELAGNVERARPRAAEVATSAGLEPDERARVLRAAFAPPEAHAERFEPRTPAEREIRALAADASRDAFAAAFRVAALTSLLAVPCALAMRRRPLGGRTPAAAAAG
jgi:EmrB/QacA subfamily drug resistance transporter